MRRVTRMNQEKYGFVLALMAAASGASGCALSEQEVTEGGGGFAAEFAATTGFNCDVLDYGIYWFGQGNVARKAVAGVANPNFSPSKPTVLFAHGWQKDSTTRSFRETFNYKLNDPKNGVDVNTADAWISGGWNVGIFYWNQFADEPEVKNAETKIWTGAGPQSMRWRKCDGSYSSVGSPTVSAAQLFYDSYVSAMAGYTGTNIRWVGHSLGNQVVTRTATMINDNINAGRIAAGLRPSRIALMDPFWSKGNKNYLNNRWTGEVSRDHVSALKGAGVIFERYKSSNINDLFVGDSNQGMTDMIGQTELIPGWISNLDQGGRHVAAPNMYFRSFAYSAPPECDENAVCSGTAASAKTSDIRIREMMNSRYEWIQTAGANTEVPSDNLFTRKNR
jgi:uncharacterized protein YjdB